MAPPEHLFPVTELENRVHSHTVDFKEKNRKLGKNFNLKDCELFELVQYSCTTQEQQREALLKHPSGQTALECWPFVRLFRRCGEGNKTFHVETTAWEGPHAWKQTKTAQSQQQQLNPDHSDSFAQYGNYFWSKR